MDCLDCQKLFGEDYKIGHDEAYEAESPRRRASEGKWLQVVLCRNGTIGPWGGSKLVASTNTAGAVAKALRALPCVRIAQDGSDGVNAVFDVADFAMVAEIMLPRKRRKARPLSEEHRAKLAAYAFKPGHNSTRAPGGVCKKHASQVSSDASGRPRGR